MRELEELLRDDAAAWQARADAMRNRLDFADIHVLRESRDRRPRRSATLIVAALATVVLGGFLAIVIFSPSTPGSGETSCVAPRLTLSGASAVPGGTVTVSGRYFVADCNDVQVRGVNPSPNQPIATVNLDLVDSAGKSFDLVLARPDASGAFALAVTVPAQASLGPAHIVDNRGERVALAIVDQ